MRYVDYDELPVEVKENELPIEDGKRYVKFYDERVRTSGGFTDMIFLVSIMAVGFMWGIIVMMLG